MGVICFIGLYLYVFSYWLGIPGWVGPLVVFGLIAAIFIVPLPILYMRSRIWLGKEMVGLSSQWLLSCSLAFHRGQVMVGLSSQWLLSCSLAFHRGQVMVGLSSQWLLSCSLAFHRGQEMVGLSSQWLLSCSLAFHRGQVMNKREPSLVESLGMRLLVVVQLV